MPQKLDIDPEQIEQSQEEEFLPTLEGAEQYFAYIRHNNMPILCIYDKASKKWRTTNQQELMRFIM